MSMKNPNDNIGNRTRDLPACSVLPHPTVAPQVNTHCEYIQSNGLGKGIGVRIYYRGCGVTLYKEGNHTGAI
jgi:hypothetical protein